MAVHATIPFVAMLRKAVLMPKWAILLTVVGSLAGQHVGAKMERARMSAGAGSETKLCAVDEVNKRRRSIRHRVASPQLGLVA